MINRFILEGFKAFNKKRDFNLAPITILIGNNGTGKSSLTKALLTYPKLFQVKTQKFDQGIKPYPIFFKNILGTYREVAGFSKIDPTDISGNSISFENIVNKSAGKDSFILGTRLPLKFFNEKYDFKLKISPNSEDFGVLNTVEIIELEKSQPLLQIISNVENNRGYLTFKIKMFKLKKQMFSLINEIIKSDRNYKEVSPDELIDINNSFDDAKRIFKKNLNSPFHKQDKLTFSSITFDELLEERIKYAFNNFNGKSTFLFNYHYNEKVVKFNKENFTDELDDESEDINTYIKNKIKYAEKKSMEELANGINIYIGPRDKFISVEHFADLFFSSSSVLIELLENEVIKHLPKDIKIESNTDLKLTEFGKLIVDEILINNFQNGILSTLKEFDEIEYIPPYKFRSDSFHYYKGSYQTIIKRLREIRQKNIWFGASEYFTEYWLKHFGIGERIEFEKLKNNQDQVYLVKGETNLPIEDQGFGLSQLIPIIYLASFPRVAAESETSLRFSESFFEMKEKIQSTFVIEEPESNLHPSNQSKLADLFIDAHWKFGHQFIVETHSEYLIRKLQYWVAKGLIKPDKIKIFAFSNDKTEKGKKDVKIKEITIKNNGDLSDDFDSGFFDESIMLVDMLNNLKKFHRN